MISLPWQNLDLVTKSYTPPESIWRISQYYQITTMHSQRKEEPRTVNVQFDLLFFVNQDTPLPASIQSMLLPQQSLPRLLPRGNQVTLCPRIVSPPAGQSRPTGLLCVVLHTLLELGSEVADKTLDGPRKGLTEG